MFKVGQTVELINDSGKVAEVGATAVVTNVGRKYLYVSWKTHANGQHDGGYYPSCFKPVFIKGQQFLFSFMG